jgi:SAM-dependent methyltransferase
VVDSVFPAAVWVAQQMSTSDDRWLAGGAYEAYMGRWSRRMAQAFVEWLRPAPSGHWLEIGCGTGALTSTICRLSEPASIIACDPSESFVEYAHDHLADARASFAVAGSEALPRRDGGFDVAVSGLVLNFLPNPEEAVAGMRGRVRRGGTVAAYVWDYADGMEFLRLFWDDAVALDPGAIALHEGKRFPLRGAGVGIAVRERRTSAGQDRRCENPNGVPDVRRLLDALPARDRSGAELRRVARRPQP